MNKDRHIIAELNSFFAESDNTKAIQGIMNVMSHNFAGNVLGQMFAPKGLRGSATGGLNHLRYLNKIFHLYSYRL